MAVVLNLQGKLDDSIEFFRKAIVLKPDYFEAHNNLGAVLAEQGRLEEAIESYRTALSLKSDYAAAHSNLGAAFKEQGNSREAIRHYNLAIEIDPNYFEAFNNLGAVMYFEGRLDAALAAYERAISLQPDYAEAWINLGRLHWSQKNFEKAFDLLEWRWERLEKFIGKRFVTNKPIWNGAEKLDVFAWAEQGVGDEIMFSSMISELNAKCKKLIVECDKRLFPLYKRSFPAEISFVEDKKKLEDNQFESHLAIGSLPKHFRHKLEDFSAVSSGWLKADPKKAEAFRKKLCAVSGDKVIGISWFTSGTGIESLRRNIRLEMLAEKLAQIPATYVNLQYGDVNDELLRINKTTGTNIVDIEALDIFNDLDGLAALITACDVVVSIDNSTVHLAGALGADTRVLLPKVADERWGLDGRNSYWYDSLKLYRQEEQDDWYKPLENLVKDLKKI